MHKLLVALVITPSQLLIYLGIFSDIDCQNSFVIMCALQCHYSQILIHLVVDAFSPKVANCCKGLRGAGCCH
jgi:hypothetical protein